MLHPNRIVFAFGYLLVTLVLSVGLSVATAEVSLKLLAVSDTDGPVGPGMGSNFVYKALSIPRTSAAGRVAFTARVYSAPTAASGSGVWIWEGTETRLVAQEAVEGPNGPGVEAGTTFAQFSQGAPTSLVLKMSPEGRLLFATRLQGPTIASTNDYGLWQVTEGSPAALARLGYTGSIGPGYPDEAVFRGIGELDIAGNGQIAFSGSVDRGIEGTFAPGDGIWRMVSGGPEVMAFCGSRGWPGLENVTDYWFTSLIRPWVNAQGDVCFVASLREFEPTITSTNDGGIWLVHANTHTNRLIAQKGVENEFGPGLGPGVRFLGFADVVTAGPVLGDDGSLIFHGVLRKDEGGVDSSNNMGLWKWHPSDPHPRAIARKGTTGPLGPGLDPDVTFQVFDCWNMNARGMLVLGARVQGPGITSTNTSGLWWYQGGVWVPVARAGTDGALGPGMGAGMFFTSVSSVASLNQRGSLVFEGTIAGNKVNSSNNRGLWIHRGGTNMLVLRTSQEIDVDPSDGTRIRYVQDIQSASDLGWRGIHQPGHTEDDRIPVKLILANSAGEAIVELSTLPRALVTRVNSDGQTTTLQWEGDPAKTYEVIYKDTLSLQSWLTLESPIHWIGSEASVVDTNASPTQQRFYWVRQNP